MNWDELMRKVRGGLNEVGSHQQELVQLLEAGDEEGGILKDEQAFTAFALLGLSLSSLHGAIEHLGIGVDALVETLREASNAQEASDG